MISSRSKLKDTMKAEHNNFLSSKHLDSMDIGMTLQGEMDFGSKLDNNLQDHDNNSSYLV
jgi:hypothetical protein